MTDEIAMSRQPLSSEVLAPLAQAGRVSRVTVVSVSPSTNSALLEAIQSSPHDWPHMSAYVADHQSAGRGRAGRTWETPAGAALTVSFVIRPRGIASAAMGWAPLVAGLAVVRALRSLNVDAWLKWPNDVVVQVGDGDVPGWGQWRKCVGILCEAVPGQDAVVAGIGINVSQSRAELPVEHAASLLTLRAASLDRGDLLARVARELAVAVEAWEGTHEVVGDEGSISSEVAAVCASIGWDVVVDVPSGPPVAGTVTGLSGDGALVITTLSGQSRTVMAGDIRVRRA